MHLAIFHGTETKLQKRNERSLNKSRSHNPSEHAEEYLEALWISEEKGKPIAKISGIAKRLALAPPSVVEMLKKLNEQDLVQYHPYRGVRLAKSGRVLARRVVRHHRLVEVLMKQTLNIRVDENVACGIEHHMTGEFTRALCSLLGHPRRCPHGNLIPMGDCCS
ncbi:MAG: metal-dependent transcriptional regulator [Candidatus Bathyarchaeota archaeon]|nr:MAG: metal-dependent transcriptional regulator [Candidatus Bathyarchaeota archaeon]